LPVVEPVIKVVVAQVVIQLALYQSQVEQVILSLLEQAEL
jgi:hypothetical protein